MNSFLALSAMFGMFLMTAVLVVLVMTAYNFLRSRRLDKALQETKLQESVSHVFDGSLLGLSPFDALDDKEMEEYAQRDFTQEVRNAEFLAAEFPTEASRAALFDDLHKIDPQVLGLKTVVRDLVEYLVPRYQTEAVKNPEIKPLAAQEMDYHMAGHAQAAVNMNNQAFAEEGQRLVEKHQEALKAWTALEAIVRSLTPEARANVRLILDQADADAMQEDEEFYQQVVEQEKVNTKKIKKIKKIKSKKTSKKSNKR